jgi:hypothetical protein
VCYTEVSQNVPVRTMDSLEVYLHMHGHGIITELHDKMVEREAFIGKMFTFKVIILYI